MIPFKTALAMASMDAWETAADMAEAIQEMDFFGAMTNDLTETEALASMLVFLGQFFDLACNEAGADPLEVLEKIRNQPEFVPPAQLKIPGII